MKKLLPILLCLAAFPALAYDLNGIRLGGKEVEIKKAMPSAHCKALEWKSDAADRRCDDSRVSVGGVETRITVFLKADAVQAYDLRFDVKELERVRNYLRSRWGEPLAEATEVISRRDKEDRKVFKMRWEKGPDRALLVAQMEKKRASLEVSHGTFPEEVYRIR
ncbi:MAG: hypothetical protein ABI654_10125 [Betaproteobacteria bacterium]